MATSFGYKPSRLGAYPHSPGASSIGARRYTSGVASALSGGSPLSGGTGYGGQDYTPHIQAQPPAAPPPAQRPHPAAVNPAAAQHAQPQLPTPGAYDLNTDPILQQIQALAGQGNEQAQAGALKQRQQLLVGYGDPNLAASILGAGDPYATAAGQNPTSVLASLGHQHEVNAHNLDEGYNQNNLFYSGARVLGQQEDTNNYQAQLAAAAQQANGGLDTIAGNLAQALAQNQQQVVGGANDAYSRALESALSGGYDNGAPTDTGGGSIPDALSPANSGLNFAAPGTEPLSDADRLWLSLAAAAKRTQSAL